MGIAFTLFLAFATLFMVHVRSHESSPARSLSMSQEMTIYRPMVAHPRCRSNFDYPVIKDLTPADSP